MAVEAHPSAPRALVSFQEGFCQEVDLATGRTVGAPIALRGAYPWANYAPDGESVAVIYNNQIRCQVERYDLATGLMLGPPLRAGSEVHKAVFHPSGRMLAVSEQTGIIRFWNLPGPMSGPPEQLTCWAEMAGRVVLSPGAHEVVRFLDDREVGARRKRLFSELGGEPTAEGFTAGR